MKPLTFAEACSRIRTRFPPELQAEAYLIAYSAYDSGVSGGLANQARNENPYLSLAAAPKPEARPKGKAR